MSFPIPETAIMQRDPLTLNTQRCRSCGAAVVWIAAGPLSASTARVENGTLVADSHEAECVKEKKR